MGKEGQLWDDSALITAFDQAISNYKKMHGKGEKINSMNVDTPLDNNNNNISNLEMAGDEDTNGSHVSVEEAGNPATVPEIDVTDSQSAKEHVLESNSLAPQDESQNHESFINSEEYNVLYKQYCEIEEQRQKILQQMQPFSNEYYPYSGEASTSGVQWGTNCATQEYQSTTQMPCGTMVVTCCTSPCQYSVPSGSALTCPNIDAPPSTKDLEIKSTGDDVDFVSEALGAAKRALSILNDKTSDSEKEDKLCNVNEQNADSETDLSTVLNAWYSAGFYTGKYLSEKSLAKKRRD